MSDDLLMDHAAVLDIGTRLAKESQVMPPGDWVQPADCGNGELTDRLRQIVGTIVTGTVGAAAEVYALGRSGIGAAEAFAETDRSL